MGQFNKFDERMLFSKAVRERLNLEAAVQSDVGTEREYWFAVRCCEDGSRVIERNYDPNKQIDLIATIDPPWYQQVWAEQMGEHLNRESAHNGAWIVAFTHPPNFGDLLRVDPNQDWRRVVKLWMDAEGDVAFALDCVDPFFQIAQRNTDHFIEQAEQAWAQWKVLMRDILDPQEHQLKPTAHLKERAL